MRRQLSKEEVIKAIERRGAAQAPVVFHKWWGDGLEEKYGRALHDMAAAYPDDIQCVWYQEPGYDVSTNANPEYRMGHRDTYRDAERHSIGNDAVLLPDWDELDAFLDHYPNPNEAGNFDGVISQSNTNDTRYRLGCWWRFLHERLWTIRGMENLMMDYYDNMDGLHRLCQKIVAFYKVIIMRYREAGCDGIFTSDDLGHQNGPMMSPAVFKELYLPYYKEIISFTHDLGMHFFLHSCGDNSLLMEYLIEAGLDVFHPIQKGCMDIEETAERFGGRISFLCGLDVQQLLSHGSDIEIQSEVAGIKERLHKDGGLLLAMGNVFMPDTPLSGIKTALDAMCG